MRYHELDNWKFVCRSPLLWLRGQNFMAWSLKKRSPKKKTVVHVSMAFNWMKGMTNVVVPFIVHKFLTSPAEDWCVGTGHPFPELQSIASSSFTSCCNFFSNDSQERTRESTLGFDFLLSGKRVRKVQKLKVSLFFSLFRRQKVLPGKE